MSPPASSAACHHETLRDRVVTGASEVGGVAVFVNGVSHPLHCHTRGRASRAFLPQPRRQHRPPRPSVARTEQGDFLLTLVPLGVQLGLGSVSVSLWHPADGRSFGTCAVASHGKGKGKGRKRGRGRGRRRKGAFTPVKASASPRSCLLTVGGQGVTGPIPVRGIGSSVCSVLGRRKPELLVSGVSTCHAVTANWGLQSCWQVRETDLPRTRS